MLGAEFERDLIKDRTLRDVKGQKLKELHMGHVKERTRRTLKRL